MADRLRLAVVPGLGLYDLVGSAPVLPIGTGEKVFRTAPFGVSFENATNSTSQGYLTVGEYRSDNPIIGSNVDQTILYAGSTYPRTASGYGQHIFIPLASKDISHTGATLSQSASADWRYSTEIETDYANLSPLKGMFARTGPNKPIDSARYFENHPPLKKTISTIYGHVGFEGIHIGRFFGNAKNVRAIFGWARWVNEEEAADITDNPWQLFRADPVRIYSFPSGPIIPTLSGLTTSHITSSGARHSLTLTF